MNRFRCLSSTACASLERIVEPEMTEQILRQLSLPRIWTQPPPCSCKKLRRIRAAYEKAREYFNGLLGRETEATTARVFQSIGR